MPLERYSEIALHRAEQEALEWLRRNEDGYPRSWAQEIANDAHRGEVLYDDWQAPPIAGYEALERKGLAMRVGDVVDSSNQQRVQFRLRPRHS